MRRIGPNFLPLIMVPVFLLVLGLRGAPLHAESAITGVRVSQHRTLTRLILTLTNPIRFRVAAADKPYRLIIDMEPVDWRLSPTVRLPGDSLVRSLRYRSSDPDHARVTAWLKKPVRVQKKFALRPKGKAKNWRLVIDLEPISKNEFERLKRAERKRLLDRRRARSLFVGRKPTPNKLAAIRPMTGSKSKPRKASWSKKRLIVLDPGHGGKDTGAISPWGLQEKKLVLRFSYQLRNALKRTGRYRVLMTRLNDKYVPLRDRFDLARRYGAHLFISLHADSNPFSRMRGLSVYTLSTTASDRVAAALAARENRSDKIAGVALKGRSKPVSGILIDLARRETMARSARFAQLVILEGRRIAPLLHKPRRSAGFAVLKAPDVPSVLIELGLLTNHRDERRLRGKHHRAKLAYAMVRAVDRFFGVKIPRKSRTIVKKRSLKRNPSRIRKQAERNRKKRLARRRHLALE